MGMTIIAVGNEGLYHRHELPNGWATWQAKKENILNVCFEDRDVVGTATRMAALYPGQDIYIFELREAYYSKPTTAIHKIYDRETGELKPV